MEKVSCPEHVRLGYNSKKLFKSTSALPSPKLGNHVFDPTSNPSSEPEIDFADVFGGPPRMMAAGKETPGLRRENLRNLQEKPVSGKESPMRRRLLSEDFFDDIYGGSTLATPQRRSEKVAFYSMPVSRILSPTRSSPPRMPPLSPTSLLPSRMGECTEVGKETQFPASVSLTPPSPYRFSVQPVQGQLQPINDAQPLCGQNMLPDQHSFTIDEQSKSTESIHRNPEGDIKSDPTCTTHASQNLQSSSQFHFSIHKWAGKGTTFLRPLTRWNASEEQNFKEEKTDRKIAFQEVGTPDTKLFVASSSNQGDFRANVALHHDLYPNRKEYRQQDENELSYGDNSSLYNLHLLTSAGNICPRLKEASESQVGHLSCLLKNDKEISGKNDAVDQKNMVRNNVQESSVYDAQKETSTCSRLDNVDAAKQSVETMEPNLDARLLGQKMRGKVKEFIKIFNQEAPQKSTPKVHSQEEKPCRKVVGASIAEAQPSTSGAWTKPEKTINGSGNLTSAHTPAKSDHSMNEEQVDYFDLQFTVREIHSPSSESNGILRTCADQESCQLMNDRESRSLGVNLQQTCLGGQLVDGNKTLTVQPQDELQNLDVRIKKWACGKEGNIRSLLSTLQYILWPESGWKPVPLVDIIEGTAVKRAYQKALLCLHPDKLQQKGGSTQQKYIAEKIFDILQDAWTNFNSVGSL